MRMTAPRVTVPKMGPRPAAPGEGRADEEEGAQEAAHEDGTHGAECEALLWGHVDGSAGEGARWLCELCGRGWDVHRASA